MKKNIRNKKYTMKEAVSYYISGYKRYEQNINQNGLEDILKDIVEVVQENLEAEEKLSVNDELLNRINFDWLLSSNDFIAYAVCIFYILINREVQITDEKIVKEFLRELHLHHPRRIMKEAEIIVEKIFSELKEKSNRRWCGMSCNFKVECIIPKEIPEEQLQNIICSKIANVIISEEKENCTFVDQSEK